MTDRLQLPAQAPVADVPFFVDGRQERSGEERAEDRVELEPGGECRQDRDQRDRGPDAELGGRVLRAIDEVAASSRVLLTAVTTS